jgi:hypothetical protein
VRRAVLTLAALAAVSVLLSGCGGDQVAAAPHAADPACGALLTRLPEAVLGRGKRSLDVAGAAQWGDPAIVLRCGVPVPGPSDDRCTAVDDVDWIFSQSKKDYEFVSYGRTPAVEVDVPVAVDRTSAPSALVDLNDAVRAMPKNTQHCVGFGDS